MSELPRRVYLDKNTPTERAIRHAINMVEALGADVRLTAAVIALAAAFEAVADWQDAQGSVASMADVDAAPGIVAGDVVTLADFPTDNPKAFSVGWEDTIRCKVLGDNGVDVTDRFVKPRVVPITKAQTSGAITALENMLHIAKTDGLTGVGVVAVDMQGNTHSVYEQGHSIALLLGAVEVLRSRLVRHYEGK